MVNGLKWTVYFPVYWCIYEFLHAVLELGIQTLSFGLGVDPQSNNLFLLLLKWTLIAISSIAAVHLALKLPPSRKKPSFVVLIYLDLIVVAHGLNLKGDAHDWEYLIGFFAMIYGGLKSLRGNFNQMDQAAADFFQSEGDWQRRYNLRNLMVAYFLRK